MTEKYDRDVGAEMIKDMNRKRAEHRASEALNAINNMKLDNIAIVEGSIVGRGEYQPDNNFTPIPADEMLQISKYLDKVELNKTKPALDIQFVGQHYKGMKIQTIEFITKNGLGFCEGNVIKYLCRHKIRNGKQDLEKAKHYIELLIELEYGGEEDSKPEK